MRDLTIVTETEARVTDALIRVAKPWGHEIIWAKTDRYVGKILHIEAGHVLSLQYHNVKDETVHLLSGHLLYRVQIDGQLTDVHLKQGESYRITPGTIHQMEAVTDCDVLEVSTPDLDDVVRLTDKYGREGTSAELGSDDYIRQAYLGVG